MKVFNYSELHFAEMTFYKYFGAKFEKSPNIHLVRPIIHLVRIFALSG